MLITVDWRVIQVDLSGILKSLRHSGGNLLHISWSAQQQFVTCDLHDMQTLNAVFEVMLGCPK